MKMKRQKVQSDKKAKVDNSETKKNGQRRWCQFISCKQGHFSKNLSDELLSDKIPF